MQDFFVKEQKIIDQTDFQKDQELKECVQETKRNLLNMYKNLNLADGNLIDYYIYRIKAEESKYDYLIKKIKELP